MNERRQKLRAYFMEVCRDLVARGVLRQARGETLDHVFMQELPRMMREMQEDLTAIGIEMGHGLIQGLISGGMKWLRGGK